uniref:ADF-H domain-containing protein n=1 Tax=Panagrellus redivivus TaxID=6233 RepID=A0A7E4VJN0_PANRE
MGCIVVKLCDPSAPDSSIRDFWHVKSVILDQADGQLDQNVCHVQKRPAGVLYVYNGRLVYRRRHCSCSNRSVKELQFEICDIQHVNSYNQFTSNCNGKTYSLKVVDIVVANGGTLMHVGFASNEAEEIGRRLKEVCIKHRQKPKIFQFNSVDVEGVEIDLP